MVRANKVHLQYHRLIHQCSHHLLITTQAQKSMQNPLQVSFQYLRHRKLELPRNLLLLRSVPPLLMFKFLHNSNNRQSNLHQLNQCNLTPHPHHQLCLAHLLLYHLYLLRFRFLHHLPHHLYHQKSKYHRLLFCHLVQ